jgi:lysophospholipase L1-like esterase
MKMRFENNKYALRFLITSAAVLILTMGLTAQSAQNKPQQISDGNGHTIVIIGASYAKHWELESIGDFSIINKGMAGQETFEILERFEKDVIREKPTAVIIWGFINDIFRSQPKNIEQKLQRARKNITTMVDMALAANIQPIVVTEVTITTQDHLIERIKQLIGSVLGKKSYQDYVNRLVIETNNWLRQYAHNKHLMLLDFEKLLSNEDGYRKREFAADDGSHLSIAAYRVLTEHIRDVDLQLHLSK